MATKLTDEQISSLLEDLQNGMHGVDAARKYRLGVPTLQRIYSYARQVGHYKGIKLTKELPEWRKKPRTTYGGCTLLPEAVIHVLMNSPRPLRTIEVEKQILSAGLRPTVNRGSVLATLSRLRKQGILVREDRGYYSLVRRH